MLSISMAYNVISYKEIKKKTLHSLAICSMFLFRYGIFIGPKSDHCQCLSLTDWLRIVSFSRLDGNSKLVELVTVVKRLLRLLLWLMLMLRNVLTIVWCRFGSWSLVIKSNFCPDFQHKFGQDFEIELQARFRSWTKAEVLV